MDAIAEVRSFNRLVARQAGILNDRQIGRRAAPLWRSSL